jgi:hypothetical protein
MSALRTHAKKLETDDVLRFTYPGYISFWAIVLIALISLAWLIMLFAYLLDKSPNRFSGFGFITAGCLSFVLFGVWLILSHSAVIELTPSGIVQRKGDKVKTIPYGDIISAEHKTFAFKSLVLKTTGGSLVIRKSIIHYQQLRDALSVHIPGQAKPDLENSLTINCSYIATYFSCLAFVLPSLAIVFIGWYVFLTGQSGIASPLVMTAVLVPFIAVLVNLMVKYPRYYVFQKNEIVQKSWVGTHTYSVSQIIKFSSGQRYVKVNAKIGSYQAHFVELEFQDSQKLSIDQKGTNYPIELLSEYLIMAYQLQNTYSVNS